MLNIHNIFGTTLRLQNTDFEPERRLKVALTVELQYKYLLSRIWGQGYENNKEYLHVFTGYLRKKLELDPGHPKNIISVPGRGYRFEKE
jgi:DNA-binding response OmpR family regulator